jgi:predicted TIM-barrel fold metal-dependent hydrolase
MPEVVGLVVCTTIDRRTLDDPAFEPLWRELSERQAVVFVHPTTGCCTEGVRDYALSLALDFLAETTNAIGRLVFSGTFTRHPGIRWIFSHLGGTTPFLIHRLDNYFGQFPECRAQIDRRPSEILRDVHFDTVSTNVAAMRCAFDVFQPAQFVFGTDYPHVPGGLEVFVDTFANAAAAAGYDDAARAAVAAGNASRLFSLALPPP